MLCFRQRLYVPAKHRHASWGHAGDRRDDSLGKADHANYDLQLKKEAAGKYRRVVELFPKSELARVARDRLANLDARGKEG